MNKSEKFNSIFESLNSLAELGGGNQRIQRQHSAGKLTARERINLLLDKNSFTEFGKFALPYDANLEDFLTPEKISEENSKSFLGDGVITGTGTIFGSPVCVFAQDFTVHGGSLGATHAEKIIAIMNLAEKKKCPIIGLNDSGGARIQEGVESLAGYADVFHRNVELSGIIPQISLILGPCAGGAVYSPALTDFIFMVRGISHMFITGPDVVKKVTGEDVTKEAIGGADAHGEKSGVSHFTYDTEEEVFYNVRELIKYLTIGTEKTASQNIKELSFLDTAVPEDSSKPYDIKSIINSISDKEIFFEIQESYAKNIVIGFSFIGGHRVGVVANQPKHLAGCLDSAASIKAARFVRFCDAFNIPIVTLVDVPGFLPGVREEHGGIIRHGSKLLYAYSEATVPKITIITRKAYGGAYDVMSSKHIGADITLAFPTAEIAVMGAEGATQVLYKENTLEKINEYRMLYCNPLRAAARGYLDDIIVPRTCKKRIVHGLEFLSNKEVKMKN